MSAPTKSLRDELHDEFVAACFDRTRAAIQLQRRDSPANRDAWRAAGDEIDAVLDVWNECKQEQA